MAASIPQSFSIWFPPKSQPFPLSLPTYIHHLKIDNTMTSTRGQHSTRSYQSLSINDAVQKLLTASETIRLRGNIKPHEDQRVKQAFNLLAQGQTPATSKTNERRNSYRHFLSYIDKECGSQMVVLAAIGLGQSAVGGMRESARLRLPLEVKKHERSLTASILQEITRRYSSRGNSVRSKSC